MASITTPTAFSAEQHQMLTEFFGKAAAEDEKTKLYDRLETLQQAQMRQDAARPDTGYPRTGRRGVGEYR